MASSKKTIQFNEKGLTSQEAKKLQKKYGKNEIHKGKKRSKLSILLEQFLSPVILLLIFAAAISLIVNYYQHQDYFDSMLILIIVLASGIAGFIQDYKAEEAVEALKKLSSPTAKVIRNGKEQVIDSADLVPGDIIVLGGGDVVPADAVIIEGELEVDESILTGESGSVKKDKNQPIYSNSNIYIGKAIAKVTAIGMQTKVGKIAAKMQEIKQESTPFQSHMNSFTKKIVLFTIGIIILTFLVSYSKFGIMEAFLIAISLAVAAIPEDLPAVITVAVSLGAKQMAKEKALIRRLVTAESIGTVEVICTDKTGTLTEGKMKLTEYWYPNNSNNEELALQCSYYCNDAEKLIKDGKPVWVGDETDIALKEASYNKIKQIGKRIHTIPFSSKKEMMTVIQEIKTGTFVYSKGAPEVIIPKSVKMQTSKGIIKLTDKQKKEILEKNEEYAKQGYRVLALAYKKETRNPEKELIFIGLSVLIDPPHPEARKAVQECHSAGIRVIMITGDNPKTAESIAQKVAIKSTGVITGAELDAMTDEELSKKLDEGVNIYARTNPFHKLRILELLQKQGKSVAMTGDGVNDSLALKKADVGIAMGLRGTEVAKEASDIILLDDNFSTIRDSIKSGRKIFDNIRKFVDYLLTCNTAEVVVVLLATIFLPYISLYPVQILWINLITDGLPALALSVDPARPDIMKRKPRKKSEGIINKKLAMLIGGIGIKKSLVIIATFLALLPFGVDVARTGLFTAFIMYEFVRIAVIRYDEKLNSLKDWLANKFLVYSLAASIALQLLIIYTPLNSYFKTVPLNLIQWTAILIGTAVGFVLGILIAWGVDKITHGEDY